MSNVHLFFTKHNLVATVPKEKFYKPTDLFSKHSSLAGRRFFKYPAFSNTPTLADSFAAKYFKGFVDKFL